MSVAGAYWKGQEGNPQLQRIYAAAFFTQKELDEYLNRLEEAKRRDHRKLGVELELFSIQEEAGPGLIFWHPKGGLIRKIVEDWLREELLKRGYDLVYTPHIMRLDLWKTSGHTGFYKDSMFGPVEVEKADYQLKPMNCPGHILIYKSKLAQLSRSSRAPRRAWHRLSLRTQRRAPRPAPRPRLYARRRAHFLHAFANRKRSGSLHGFRLRRNEKFRLRQIRSRALRLGRFAPGKLRRQTGRLATRHGRACRNHEELNIPYKTITGEAAFYGPKIDVKLIDAIGRPWQLTTVQFDFNLPARFGLEYVAEDGAKHQPLMVHRALLGSVERFFGILIEHYAGAFPLWLAPVQVQICPVSEKVADYAKHVTETLKRHNIRVHLDDRNEKLPAKIRDAQLQKIPYMLIVGAKEAEAGTVSVRHRSKGDLGPKPLAEVIAALQEEVTSRALA